MWESTCTREREGEGGTHVGRSMWRGRYVAQGEGSSESMHGARVLPEAGLSLWL